MRSLTEDPFQKEGLLSLMPRTFQGVVRSADSLDPLDVEAIDNIQRQKILCDISIKEMQKAKEVLTSCDNNFHQQKAIQKSTTVDDMLGKFKENIPPDDNFQNARIKREGTGRVSSRRRFSFSSSVLEPVLKVEKNYQELDVSAFFEDAQRREEAEKIKRQMMGEKSPELFSHESQNTRVRRKGTGRKVASKNFVWDPPDNVAKIMEIDEVKLCVEEDQKLGITFVGPEKFSDLEAGFKIDHIGCGLLYEGSQDNQNQINVSQEPSSAAVDGEASVILPNDLLSTILASDGSEMHESPKITNTVENLGSKAMHHELPITLLQGQNDSSDKITLQSCLDDANDIARLPEYWRHSKAFENRLFSSLNDNQAANRNPSHSPTPSPSELFAALNAFKHVEDSGIANQECDVVNAELERNNNSSSTIYFSEFNAKENSYKQKKICRRNHLSRPVCSEKEDDVDLPCDAFNHSIPNDETPNASAKMFDNGLKDENRESRNPLITSTPSRSGIAAAKFSDCHKMTQETTTNSSGKLFISESVETSKTQDTSSSPLKLSGNTKSNPSRDQNLSSKKKTLILDCPPSGPELVDNLAETDKVSHGLSNSTENRKSAVLERSSSIRMKQRLNFDFALETAESLEEASSIPITISSTKNSKSKESGSSIPGTAQLSMKVEIEKQEKLLEMVANAPDYMINTDKENQIVPLGTLESNSFEIGHASTSPVDQQTQVSAQSLHRRNVKKVNPTSQDKWALSPRDNTLNQFVNMEQKNEKRIRRRADCKPRQSLAGAGTFWKSGVRRSTRIRSRPLEYWRGERFLYGRIHESLATVIGIKYTSPLRDGIKSKQLPKFKVESFVDDRYSDLVQFAAKH